MTRILKTHKTTLGEEVVQGSYKVHGRFRVADLPPQPEWLWRPEGPLYFKLCYHEGNHVQVSVQKERCIFKKGQLPIGSITREHVIRGCHLCSQVWGTSELVG